MGQRSSVHAYAQPPTGKNTGRRMRQLNPIAAQRLRNSPFRG